MSISTFFTTLLCFLVFMLGPIHINAQTPTVSSAQNMANQLTRNEVKSLSLNEKEAKDLKEINLMYTRQLQKLNRTSNADRKDIEALKRSHSLKIKSLLSSEKYRKYLELKEQEQKKEKDKEN